MRELNFDEVLVVSGGGSFGEAAVGAATWGIGLFGVGAGIDAMVTAGVVVTAGGAFTVAAGVLAVGVGMWMLYDAIYGC
jgi:hypothetical protein